MFLISQLTLLCDENLIYSEHVVTSSNDKGRRTRVMPLHATAELHNIARNVAGVELKRVLLLQHFLHCVSASCDIARIVTQQKVFSQSDFLVYY